MSHRLTPDETKALLRRDFPIDIVQPEEEEEYWAKKLQRKYTAKAHENAVDVELTEQ